MTRAWYVILLLFMSSFSIADDKLAGKLNILIDLRDLSILPTHLYVQNTGLYSNANVIDTIQVNSSYTAYSSRLAEPSRLRISAAWPDQRIRSAYFWATPANYTLKIQNMTPVISGDVSVSAQKLADVDKAARLHQSRTDSLVRKVDYRGRSVAEAEKLIGRIRDSMATDLDEVVYKNLVLTGDGVTSLYALQQYAKSVIYRQPSGSQLDSLTAMLRSLSPELQKLPSAIALDERLKYALSLLPGNMIADIELQDTIGDSFRISDFKGKYVLIEFWASWCAPCRQDAPALIQLYEKYKPSDFRIIGITRDELSTQRAWLNAVRKDKIGIWPQLGDFDQRAKKLYDIDFIPANFLIDPQGLIIGKNLRGEELSITLARLFDRQ